MGTRELPLVSIHGMHYMIIFGPLNAEDLGHLHFEVS